MTKTFPILPDLTCPELAGYKLPPCSRCQEDGVEIPQGCHEEFEFGFQSGYHKAREKFEFTEADINNALSYGYHTAKDELNGIHSTGYGTRFIQSIRTPRHPIAIEVEMVEARSESFTINGCDSFTEVGCIKQVCTCYDFIPATNPDGTVKGRWVYE